MPGFLKNITWFHLLPAGIAALLASVLFRSNFAPAPAEPANRFSRATLGTLHNFDKFYPNDITHETALAVALKQRVPVLFGSSELTSHHLPGIAYRFFDREASGDRFLAVGHAGFQCLAVLATLAANRPVLQDAKITIILSPGWFEKQYANGTSLTSFFEFCPPNYLYQIYRDSSLDATTRRHIERYIYRHFDKITKPDAVMRAMGKKKDLPLQAMFNYPFLLADDAEISCQAQRDMYLGSQQRLMQQLAGSQAQPYHFDQRIVNWDSLFAASEANFANISNNNTIGVENSYYESWLKDRPKKRVEAVPLPDNQEYQDLEALVHFLSANGVKPAFVIMPLNPLAHENLSTLDPTMTAVAGLLRKHGYPLLDMYHDNSTHYRKGVLEDIMHPYDLGWYQIDRFILDTYHD